VILLTVSLHVLVDMNAVYVSRFITWCRMVWHVYSMYPFWLLYQVWSTWIST